MLVAGSVGEDQSLVAGTAGHAQRHVAPFRHGHGALGAVRIGGQEDRRLARIGGRRHPGVDPRRDGLARGVRPEAVAETTAEGAEGKSEGHDEQKGGGGANTPRVALRNLGARQVAAHSAELLGHAFLVFAPQGLRKTRFRAARPVGLHEHGRVQQIIGGFDAPVDLDGRRPPEETQRIERGKRGQRQQHHHREAAHIRQDAEHAEPGQADEQADGYEQRQDQRPAAFHHHCRPYENPRPGQPSGKTVLVPVCGRFCHRPFQLGPRGRAGLRLER
jgi:hypothetical protein